MANSRYNTQVANKRVAMKEGGKAKKPIKQESKGRRMTQDDLKLAKEMSKRDRYKSYAKNKKTRAFKTPKEAAEVDIKLQRLVDYNRKKGDPVDVDVIGMKSYEKPTSKMGSFKSGGKVLKAVDKEKNPGLAKLPTQVRNKMGFMKKGGRVKKSKKKYM